MISEEAVEAAAKEIDAPSEPAAQEIARRALVAAAPHMLAGAWEEGEQAGYVNHAAEQFGGEYTNPYRSEP